MGVFKEHANAFETVAKRQSRIYTDAADYGVTYNSKNVPVDVKRLIDMVNDLKGTLLIKKRTEYLHGVEVIIEIAWEIDEGFECGTRYTINFNKISGNSRIDKNTNAMISVDINNYRKKV